MKMKIDKYGKFWAGMSAIVLWTGYVITWFIEVSRSESDFLLLLTCLFTSFAWIAEDE